MEIGSGKYVFGKNIPVGSYDLKALSGSGMLSWKIDGDFGFESFGVEEGDAKTYYNMSGEEGDFFMLENNVVVEITKSKPLIIDF